VFTNTRAQQDQEHDPYGKKKENERVYERTVYEQNEHPTEENGNKRNRTCLRTQRLRTHDRTQKKHDRTQKKHDRTQKKHDRTQVTMVRQSDTRRETLTNDQPNTSNADDAAEDAYHIETVGQLNHWLERDAEAVADAMRDLRKENLEIVKEYNDQYADLVERNRKSNALRTEIAELKEQIQEQQAVIDRQRQRLRDMAARAEREETPTTTASQYEKRSTKLPDAPVLTDGKEPQFTAWLIQIQGKLEANADHYPTEALKISYVATRCGGLAASNIQPRLRRDATKPFHTANEVLEVLERTFGDPFRKRTARNEFRNLKQGNRDFNSFWSDFQRLTADMDESEETLVEDLRHKVSIELRTALAADRNTTDLFELAQSCQYIDQELRDVGRARQNLSRFTPRLVSTTASASPRTAVQEKTTTTTTSTSAPRTTFSPAARAPYVPRNEYRPPRNPHTDAMKEKLMREGKCFHCQKSGHVARECPDKPSALHEMEVDGGVVLNDSEKE